jgi:hypothetical protein
MKNYHLSPIDSLESNNSVVATSTTQQILLHTMANNTGTKKVLIIQEYSHKDHHHDLGTAPLSPSQTHQPPLREYQLIAETRTEHKNNKSNSDTKAYGTILCRQKVESSSTNTQKLFFSLRRLLQDLFLPAGYPHSLGKEANSYWKYQLWDGIQGLCSYWRGVVATKAVLQGAGVGNPQANALSAAVQWAIRDGTGMVGGLLYSYQCSVYFDSHALECRWLLADVSNDVALTCDMLMPHLSGQWYVGAALISTLGKTMCGITAGATKGRITHHFARHSNNMADLTAKESTQETLVSLLGMIGGVLVANGLEQTHHVVIWTWIFFIFLTLFHIWANYMAVLVVKLTTLNPERVRCLFQQPNGFIEVLVQHLLAEHHNHQQQQQPSHGHHDITMTTNKRLQRCLENLPSPQDIHESLWRSTMDLMFPTIRVRDNLDQVLPTLDECTLLMNIKSDSNNYNTVLQDMPYIMGWKKSTKKSDNSVNRHRIVMYLWLKVDAQSARQELQAYVHALVLQNFLLLSTQPLWTNEDPSRSVSM